MIKILSPADCCGCSACEQICPLGCISMQEDSEWFAYPVVDTVKCIDCGLCEKVCPIINSKELTRTQGVFAVKSKDDNLRLESSSGGVFTLLAEKILDDGGIVFGACYDSNWEVTHSWIDTKQGLEKFRGSKYVQSRINGAYKDAEMFLKAGRKVLFSGTPCQISGLRLFLRKNYDNLVMVDVACHGVPSPGVWRKYLQEVINKHTVVSSSKDVSAITGINFRDKRFGWKKYSFVVYVKSAIDADNSSILLSDIHSHNVYMDAFLSDLSLRPSCYDCRSKLGRSGSDITIADYWGIDSVHPGFNDDKGVSLVILNTEKGERAFNDIDVIKEESCINEAVKCNPSILISVKQPKKRALFFENISADKSIKVSIEDSLRQSFVERCYEYGKHKAKTLLKRL